MQMVDVLNRIGRERRASRGAAELDAHPCRQLVRVERLGDEVISAAVECPDLVPIGVSGRDDHDWADEPPTELTTELEAVAVRELQVEDDEIRGRRGGEVEPVPRGRRLEHVGGVEEREAPHGAPDMPFVVDEQHGRIEHAG